MERQLLLIGGVMFVLEGMLKFVRFTFLGMNMPCGGSLMIVGLGLAMFAARRLQSDEG
jgi:uncharacterized membrane protein YgdD (TMEM256/DUF423 family)